MRLEGERARILIPGTNRELRRVVTVTLSDELMVAVGQFMIDEQYVNQAAALRDLLHRAFTTSQISAAAEAAKRKAYAEVRGWALASLMTFLKEMNQIVETSIREGDGITRAP